MSRSRDIADGTRFVDAAGDRVNGTLAVGNGLSNTGLDVHHGNSNGTGYGAIRFYEDGTNNTTIHAFPTNWEGGVFPSKSAGCLNIGGLNGVTVGAWNDPRMWINEGTREVGVSGQLKQFGSNLVIDDERGSNIANVQSYTMTAGSNYKLAEIMQVGDTERVGLFGLLIWMGDGGPFGGGTHYWNATYSGIIGPNQSGTAYNATGAMQLTLNRHYHHITVAEPTFYLDSDNANGAYGNTCLYINVPINTQWYNIGVFLKRLAW